ncbi:MAG: hypothetical protein ABJF11_06655 [Reichenbachiella sp.]|uniref:hypothetical protein n=1 Tax=Reichenbachiella sp. TaxID=2184521 RepID=UPI0032661C7E
MNNKKRRIRITHNPSGELIAEGEKGWGMFSFEGNYYIAEKNLKTLGFKFSGIPGICPYKFIYFWYHFESTTGIKTSMLGWKYWLPNPLFPFIAFRIAVPINHPDLTVENIES